MKQFAIQLAKKAGQEAMKYFKKPQKIKFKSQREIVTPSDLIAEKIIISAIRKRFPSHQILSEETEHDFKKAEYLWIIDPIDGTTNYSFGNPLFAVSIALAKKGAVILGVGFAPALNELYVAEKGRGAVLNGKKIAVSEKRNVARALLTYCHGYAVNDVRRATKILQHFTLEGYDCRQLGSAVIELGFVAVGRTEAIMIPGARAWDLAAGVLVVREAGGVVTDFEGWEWNLESKDMVASNSRIHNQLITFLKQL